MKIKNKKTITLMAVTVIILAMILAGCGNAGDDDKKAKGDNALSGTEQEAGGNDEGAIKSEQDGNETEGSGEDPKLVAGESNEGAGKQVTSENKEATEKPAKNTTATLTGEFKSFSAQDIYGNTYAATDIFGEDEIVVVNIWGTFCGPCINEMPDLGALASEYKGKGVKFVGIAVDVADETTLKKAKTIVSETGANYIHLLPTEDLYNIYLKNVSAVPETLIVDKSGTIIDSFLGSRSKSAWKKIVEDAYADVV